MKPTPRPLTTQVYYAPHAPDPSRRVCLEWRLLGDRPVYWWYPSEGAARQAEAGLKEAPDRARMPRWPCA